MNAIISQWGNSLAVRIPKPFAKDIGFHKNQPIRISTVRGRMVIEPEKLSLEDLLSQITPENKHSEISSGISTGKEAW